MAVTITGKKIVANERGNNITFTGLNEDWALLGDLYLRVFDPTDLTVVIGSHQLEAVSGNVNAGYLPDTDGVFPFIITTEFLDVPIKLYIDDGVAETYLQATINAKVRVYP